MAKYLDEKGLQHLWSKISMEDYPNNETLIAVLNAIDQTKVDKSEVGQVIYKVQINDSTDGIHRGVIENYNQQRPHFLFVNFSNSASRGSGSIQINDLDPLPIGGNISDAYQSLVADIYNSADGDYGLYYCDGMSYIILPSGREYVLQIAVLKTIFKNYLQAFGSQDNPLPPIEEVLSTLMQNYEENNIQPIRDNLNHLGELFALTIQRMYELEQISSIDELPPIREIVNEEIQNHMDNLNPTPEGGQIHDSLILTDTVTGINYSIAIVNGKLTMQEV